jgi:hypothetical protein
MLDSGMRRAAVLGIVAGLLCVLAVVLATVAGGYRERTAAVPEGPLVIAVALRDSNETPTIRSLDLLGGDGVGPRLVAVSPDTSVTVPGTSATTLADAYAFGGGSGLSGAITGTEASATAGWVIVSPKSLGKLLGASAVRFDLPEQIAVFDGTRLYTFPSGVVSVPVAELGQLMDGAEYLPVESRRSIREQLGSAVADGLIRRASQSGLELESSLTTEQLQAWLAGVKAPSVRADTDQ